MMNSSTRDSAMLFYFEWEDSFEDLSDAEYRQMIQAIQAYARTGEEPKFEDRTLRSVFKLVKKAVDRNTDRYAKKCEKNKENGRKGGAPKGNQNAKKTTETTQNNRTVEKTTETTQNNPKQPKTTETTLRERERERERVRERDPERERGGGGEPSAHTTGARARDDTTTTTLKEEIVNSWNAHDFTQRVIHVDSPKTRWLKTQEAISKAGGAEAYIELLKSLDEHAYFRNQNENGYKLIYDWFVNPENFQGVLEGRYRDVRSRFGEGWEVVEYG